MKTGTNDQRKWQWKSIGCWNIQEIGAKDSEVFKELQAYHMDKNENDAILNKVIYIATAEWGK